MGRKSPTPHKEQTWLSTNGLHARDSSFALWGNCGKASFAVMRMKNLKYANCGLIRERRDIVNADLILPLFADEILPVSIRSVEANGPDTQALFHPV
jgi:hypothetical protein